MTLEQLKTMSNELTQAIHDYTQEKDFNSIELERTLDELLCRLPRDIIYVEWYDRSDIQNMADGIYDEPANDDLVDICMHELWEYNNSIMDNEIVEDIVCDSVRQQHINEQTTCDFCGCKIQGKEYDNDGETIMCKTCQESGKFGHYDTNKGEHNDD